MEGTCERAEGANPGGCDYSSCSDSSFPWLHTLPAAMAPSPWLPGVPVRGAHTQPALGRHSSAMWSSLLLLSLALAPGDKEVPKGQFALKGSRLRRAPMLHHFAMPLQATVKLLSGGSCLRVRAAAQDELIILPSFITG